MKVITKKACDVVEDVHCDVCGTSTSNDSTHAPEFGVLQADWGYGSQHDGERYELHLCETCFFSALATLKAERSGCQMFDDDLEKDGGDNFGRV
ncbi:hypothetical protein [Marinobacterium stanieri]|uniref:hypothetical protein n=1 Tax=Marinobacterium stanieri TaxID=49186 RepID=UPI003A955071